MHHFMNELRGLREQALKVISDAVEDKPAGIYLGDDIPFGPACHNGTPISVHHTGQIVTVKVAIPEKAVVRTYGLENFDSEFVCKLADWLEDHVQKT